LWLLERAFAGATNFAVLFATAPIFLVATALCMTTCERTVFSGRNSNESRESLPGSTLIEGTMASPSCSTSLVDVPKSPLVSG